METISRLVRDPSIKDAKLVIQGTDILVEKVEVLIESNISSDQIIEHYPELTENDIEAIKEYIRIKKNTLFSCVNLTKSYESRNAIDNLTYSTKANALGLFGPNGSGKSTLINLLLELQFPSNGLIEINIDKSDIRVVPDYPILPKAMSVDEWISTLERIYGFPIINIDFQKEFKLDGSWLLKNLSAGQYRLAALLPIFFGTPKLIVVDEPTNFLDAYIRDKVLMLLKQQIKKSSTKLIIASHRIEEINIFAERVLMLYNGRMLADIDMADDIKLKYTVLVDNFNKFVKHLEKRKVNFSTEETSLGETVILEITPPVWTSLKQYLEAGNIIFSINKLDKLQAKFKEEIK